MDRWIKRIIVVLCLIFIMTNSIRVDAMSAASNKKQDEIVIVKDSLVITLNIGFNQEVRYGRFSLMQINVYNKGETIEGEVTVVLINENQDNIAYSKETVFAGGDKSEVEMLLPMNRASQEMVLRIEEEGKTIVEELIPLQVMNLGDYCFVGLLSERPEELSYFEYFGNKVVNLDKTNLPNDYMAYDLLDVIVIDEFNLDSLEVKELEALIDWTRRGGALILGIGDDYMPNVELLEQYHVIEMDQRINYEAENTKVFLASLVDDQENKKQLAKINNYEATRSKLLQDIKASKEFDSSSAYNVYVGSSMLSGLTINDLDGSKVDKYITSFSLKNRKTSIVSENNYLYEAVDFGQGVVQLFHFGLSNPKMTAENLSLYENAGGKLLNLFYSSIVMTVLEQRSNESINKNKMESYTNTQDYRISNLGKYPEMGQVPQVLPYIIVLVIYLLLIGPVLFYILWKRKRQMKVWIYVPLITLLFLGVMYFMGSSTRINEPYAGYMNIEYYDTSLNEVVGDSFASIVLANKSINSVEMGRADSLVVDAFEYPTFYGSLYQTKENPQRFYDYGKEATKATDTGEGIELTFYNRPAFSGELFQATYHKPYEAVIQGEVFLDEYALSGTIRNQSKIDLKQALLWVNGHYINLGRLKAGSEVDLGGKIGLYAVSIESLLYMDNPISKTLGYIASQTFSARQNREIETLSYIYSKYLKDTQSAYVIAFTDQVPGVAPIAKIAKQDASFGVSAVVAKVNLNTQVGSKTLISNMDQYLESSSDYTWDQITRFAYMSAIEFTYGVPKTERIQSIFLSDLFNDFSDQYNTTSCSRIYLYNYRIEKYDLIFDLESEYGNRSISGEDLSPYIDENNKLKIKYENRSATQDILTVPILSCYKEAVDATN